MSRKLSKFRLNIIYPVQKMTSIIIADDHPLIRYGLKQIISEDEEMIIKGDAENGNQLLKLISENYYDILLLDLGLPDIDGFQILGILRNFRPDMPVLVLSAYREELYAITAIKYGASGYLNKIAASDQLVSAIKKVVSGGLFISKNLSEKLVDTLKKDRMKIFSGNLPDNDFEVMCLIASGKTIDEISEILKLDISVIEQCRLNIFNKAKITKDSELLRYCMNKDLITP